jgi:hypothetical protein
MTIKLVFVASPLSIKEKKADWMARNQDNMSEWSDMSIRGLLLHKDQFINRVVYKKM